ncbi:MAG TPA: hypothetical protein PKW02_00220 [Pseudomonadales bacterium]|nr:hypothetical protein [Pseudomonadales bacterium]
MCLLFAGWPLAAVYADSCSLAPMAEQLQQPGLRADKVQHAEFEYRRQLLRFANGYYGSLAQDILRGEGEYLHALQRLMGAEGCLDTYRQLLLQETSGLDFALALWLWRTGGEVNTVPAQDWGGVTN